LAIGQSTRKRAMSLVRRVNIDFSVFTPQSLDLEILQGKNGFPTVLR
jgi:hypothetical protein